MWPGLGGPVPYSTGYYTRYAGSDCRASLAAVQCWSTFQVLVSCEGRKFCALKRRASHHLESVAPGGGRAGPPPGPGTGPGAAGPFQLAVAGPSARLIMSHVAPRIAAAKN